METNPVYNAILKRRSIRNFLDTPVEKEKIEILLKAAMAAPSACNLQPWEFIVVDDQEGLKSLKSCTEQGKYNAPLAIVVCGVNHHIPWQDEGWREDCAFACENMMLVATELDLASVCVGGFDEEAIAHLLEIPSYVYPMCIIEFGYPSYTLPPKTWYTEDAVHYQKYNDKKRKMRTLEMLAEDAKKGII